MSDVHEVRAREEDWRSAMLAADASALIVETPHKPCCTPTELSKSVSPKVYWRCVNGNIVPLCFRM
jgi:hypothetical protein